MRPVSRKSEERKKISRARLLALAFLVAVLVPSGAGLLAQDVVISEFMASNVSTLEDEDGDYSDWIELFNAGQSPADLDGWSLTDDPLNPTKWVFPPIVLPPRSFLIVFASGKDRRNPALPLHTGFKLAMEGGHLALLDAAQSIVWEYATYPAQVDDFSYGLKQSASIAPLVEAGAPARALVPADSSVDASWRNVGFSDAGWVAGTTGLGYDENPDYLEFIGLNVITPMNDVNTTAYLRVPFTVAQAGGFSGLVLRMMYDDGFIAYVNGTEIARRNAPAAAAWNSRATSLHDEALAVVFEEIQVPGGGNLILQGNNVLAIHGLNENPGSSDFLIVPELDGTDPGVLDRDVREFFDRPTPRDANLPGWPGIAGSPVLSLSSQVFTSPLTLSITAPAGTLVRTTTDGSLPTASSPAYTGPIPITTSTRVRARSFQGGVSPSPAVGATFIGLAADARGFTSNLPIIILDNFGGGGIPQNSYQNAYMAIFDPKGGRSALNSIPDVESRVGMKIRGSSTAGQPKPNLRIETWNEDGVDQPIAPLGFPREADWILHAPYGFDRALIRNPLMYELSNRVGSYAVRTRFCEVYINTGGGLLSQADYFGVYSFMENIKRDEDRVDVERLDASDVAEPDITGGYILKIDRLDPGDSGFSAAGQTMGYVYPKEDNISPPQAAWLTQHMNAFAAALNGAGFANPQTGYAAYIDPEAWVDHNILNVLAKNVDALRLSAYFYKPRGERISFGPIWDFDRSINSTDGRDDDPRTWNGTGDATDFFNYPWWGRLFQDPEFWQLWIDRWFEMRRGPLGTTQVNAVVDGMAAEISEAQARNFQRWSGQGGSGWASEITLVKTWLSTRSSWIDSQFLGPPVFSRTPGSISPGDQLSMTSPPGTIHYTLDGTDPRLRGGGVAPGAAIYSAPLTLSENVRVVARVKSGTTWGGKVAGTFYTELPDLVITEIMYHPPAPVDGSRDPDDFEFIEFLNRGIEPIELGGIRLDGAIRFTFPDLTLSPGEYIVLVRDLAAFGSRYGAEGITIGGVYQGHLSNAGEEVLVRGPLDEPIHTFRYGDDDWHPLTDGAGESLTIIDPEGPLEGWGLAESWGPSFISGGTPGGPDGGVGGRQRPGDSNQDGIVDLSDALSLLLRLFVGEAPAAPCEGSLESGGNLVLLDVNGDAVLDVSDAIHLLGFMFQNGPPPAQGGACIRIEGCPDACGL